MNHNDQLVQRVLRTFLADMPGKIAELDARAARNDLTAARALAHAIKGAACNASAEALTTLACQLEKADNIDQIRQNMERLDNEFARLQAAIQETLLLQP